MTNELDTKQARCHSPTVSTQTSTLCSLLNTPSSYIPTDPVARAAFKAQWLEITCDLLASYINYTPEKKRKGPTYLRDIAALTADVQTAEDFS